MKLIKVAGLAVVAIIVAACADSATGPIAGWPSTRLMTRDESMDACKNGGYADWKRTDGTEFKNQGACVSYLARGGTLVPKAPPPPPPVITSFIAVQACDGFTAISNITAVFSGGTGELFVYGVSQGAIESGVTRTVPRLVGVDPTTIVVTNAAGVTATATWNYGETDPSIGCFDPGVRKFRRIGAGK